VGSRRGLIEKISPVFLVAVVTKRVIACRRVLEVCSKGFEVAL
jgi:hypothetical protein